MDKNIVEHVLRRSDGLCEVCRGNKLLQFHHTIKGSGKRKQCETKESVVLLCWDCHYGNEGIHGKNGKKLDLQLKLQLQATYKKQGYSEGKIRKLMGGKIYGSS